MEHRVHAGHRPGQRGPVGDIAGPDLYAARGQGAALAGLQASVTKL